MFKSPSVESQNSFDSINETAPKTQILSPETSSFAPVAQQATCSTQQLPSPVEVISGFKPQSLFASKPLADPSKLPIRSCLKREVAEREALETSCSDVGDYSVCPRHRSDPPRSLGCEEHYKPRVLNTLKGQCNDHNCCSRLPPHLQSSRLPSHLGRDETALDMPIRNLIMLIEELGTLFGKVGGTLADSIDGLTCQMKSTANAAREAHKALEDTIRKTNRRKKKADAKDNVSDGIQNKSPALVNLLVNSTTMTVNICGTIITDVVIITDGNCYNVAGNVTRMMHKTHMEDFVQREG